MKKGTKLKEKNVFKKNLINFFFIYNSLWIYVTWGPTVLWMKKFREFNKLSLDFPGFSESGHPVKQQIPTQTCIQYQLFKKQSIWQTFYRNAWISNSDNSKYRITNTCWHGTTANILHKGRVKSSRPEYENIFLY